MNHQVHVIQIDHGPGPAGRVRPTRALAVGDETCEGARRAAVRASSFLAGVDLAAVPIAVATRLGPSAAPLLRTRRGA